MNYHGNDGEVHIGANVVAEVTAFTHTNSVEFADDSVAGDDYRTRKAGKKDGQGQISMRWDPTNATGQVALALGATVSVILYPGGPGTGKGKLAGDIQIESIQVDHDQDDIVARTVTYKGYLAESLAA